MRNLALLLVFFLMLFRVCFMMTQLDVALVKS